MITNQVFYGFGLFIILVCRFLQNHNNLLENSVNKRLSGDESEDPEFPKVQWPSASLCEPCHTNSDNGGFNTDEVHQFILNRNKLENIILPVDEKLIHSTDEDSNADELIVDEEVEVNGEPR